MTWRAAILAAALSALTALPAAAAPDVRPGQAPVALGATYELASAITGRPYRIYLFVPAAPPPPAGFPVIYFTDGNYDFNIATQTARVQAATGEIPWGVIVGIGYPTEDGARVHTLRVRDLSLPSAQDALPNWMVEEKVPIGEAEAFYRVLIEEIRPFVERRAPIDRGCETLYGHSLGGLFVLNALFNHTGDFRTYVAASPSIWWDHGRVLKDEPAFRRRLAAGQVRGQLMLTVGSREEPPGAARWRMVGNVRDMAGRLAGLAPGRFKVSAHVFDDESHNSSVPAAVSKTLRLGLCPATPEATSR